MQEGLERASFPVSHESMCVKPSTEPRDLEYDARPVAHFDGSHLVLAPCTAAQLYLVLLHKILLVYCEVYHMACCLRMLTASLDNGARNLLHQHKHTCVRGERA